METTWKIPGEAEEECKDMFVNCLVWIYATPLEEELDDDGVCLTTRYNYLSSCQP